VEDVSGQVSDLEDSAEQLPDQVGVVLVLLKLISPLTESEDELLETVKDLHFDLLILDSCVYEEGNDFVSILTSLSGGGLDLVKSGVEGCGVAFHFLYLSRLLI
jgi:hypothetical protein